MSDYVSVTIAGLHRMLPIYHTHDDTYMGSLDLYGDVEFTVACATALIAKMPPFDLIIAAEPKPLPLVHEIARQMGLMQYIVARKTCHNFINTPISVDVSDITKQRYTALYLDPFDAELMRYKRVMIIDDLISDGYTVRAVEKLVKIVGGTVCCKMCIVAAGDAAYRDDILCLHQLPALRADGTVT